MIARSPRAVCFVLAAILFARHGAAFAGDAKIEPVVALLELVLDADEETARSCLSILTQKIQTGELSAAQLDGLKERLSETVDDALKPAEPPHPLHFEVAVLAAAWKHSRAVEIVRKTLQDETADSDRRLQALEVLLYLDDLQAMAGAKKLLSLEGSDALDLRARVLAALGNSGDPRIADVVLAAYEKLDPELQPKAVELLTQRPAWSHSLLTAIGEDRIPKTVLNLNQVSKLLASRDEALREAVLRNWGTVREERNPQREQVIAEVRELLATTPGDPFRGEAVFHRVCGQCHKMHGRGHEVGPDITGNGRNSFEQLLSNVLDPNLVIGAAYQARTVITDDGRVLTGLLAEDNAQRVVLKVQGGKQEIIPRDQIDELQVSPLSLMPEGLENQLKPEELVDLFAFLILDGPPQDPDTHRIPGADGVATSVLRDHE